MPHHDSIIYVDVREKEHSYLDRNGVRRTSGVDMLSLVRDHRDKVNAQPKFLNAGDFCFAGDGPKGPCLIGVERKRVKDMLSSMRTGRYSGKQLPKLFDQYEFVHLVLEGRHRANWYSGIVEEPCGKDWSPVLVGTQTFLSLELESYLNKLKMRLPSLTIRHTITPKETVDYVVSLHHTFSTPWDKHHAHIAIHLPPEYATVGKASVVRRVAYALPDIGWERSRAVEESFRSVEEMVNATPRDWAKLEGFGKVLSTRTYKALHGEYDLEGLE